MSAAAAGAAAAAARAKAIKASGVVVWITPEDFQTLLLRAKDAIVVQAEGGLFSHKHRYLVSYKGLAFFTKSIEPIQLPSSVEVITASKIWVPD
jgi:hypothetical protein